MLRKSMSLIMALIMSVATIPVAKESSSQLGASPGGMGGLADSPWPMFRHNLNHSGLSPHDTSGNQGDLRWSFMTGRHVTSSPAIGSNGTIYVGSTDYNLYAINPDGTRKWNFNTTLWVFSSPAIGSDGTIYIGSDAYGLHAINPDGTEKWCFNTSRPFSSSPAIGSDGIIYAASLDGALYAINPDGTENWNYYDLGTIRSSPSIGSDGTIYVGSQDSNLYAINSDGTLRWLFSTDGEVNSSPATGPDGTIYVGSWDGKLYAINTSGYKKWDFATGSVVESSPAIGPDGTIYVGSWDGKLYAINPDGSKKWSFTTDSYVRSSPAIGSDGSVYVGSDDYKLYAVNPDGSERWNFTTGNVVRSSPAIGTDGTIYVGSWDHKLYAIGLSQNQPPVADAGPNQTVFEGDTVQFNGSGSYDPEDDWKITSVDGGAFVGTYTSIALDSNDRPHISYYDNTNENLKYARWTGSNWVIETVDSPGSVGRFSSIALDSHDKPHISYYDSTKLNLKYAKRTGISWGIVTLDSEGNVGSGTSIALDSHDIPHISYIDATNKNVKYANRTGGAWNFETVEIVGRPVAPTSIALDSRESPYMCVYKYNHGRSIMCARWTGSIWRVNSVSGPATVDSSMALDSNDIAHIGYRSASPDGLSYDKWIESWQREIVDPGDVGRYVSIALDSNDAPHMSYSDMDNESLKYTKRTGSNWSIETVDSGGVGRFTSLAIDSGDSPHISYCDYANGDLKYAKWTGSGWSIETVEAAGDVVGHTSIDLDSDNNPHISYSEYFGHIDDSNLKYAKWTGSGWSIERADSSGDVGRISSLALDGNNYPHIGYSDLIELGNADLKYAKRTGSGWSTETVDTNGSISFISIAVDSNDNPHMSYYQWIAPQDAHIKYAKWTGSGWSIETVDSIGDLYRYGTSIVLDTNDNPHIGYHDFRKGDLKYAKWTGSGWSIETVDSYGDVGGWPSLALDSNDRPHMSYLNSTIVENEGVSDLKYARRTGNEWKTETVDSVGHVGRFSSIAIDGGDNPQISYQDYTNRDLKYAFWTGSSWVLETVDSAGMVGSHTSIALDSLGNPHISYLDETNEDLKYANKRGGIVSYHWDFGDGSPHGSGKIAEHVYSSPGVYNVTLTVTDRQGASDDDWCLVTVLQRNQPPVADAGSDQSVHEGDTVYFDGTDSHDPDGGIGDWSARINIPSPRAGGGSATLKGEIYYGGGDHFDLVPRQSSVFQKYDPATDSWSDLPDLPEPRAFLGLATVNGKIYAIGGNDGTNSTNTTFEFDPATQSWTSRAPIPIQMEAFGTAVINDRVYLVGGSSTFVYCYPCAFVFEYDPSTDSWTQKKDLPTGRAKLATTVLDGKIFAIGGHPTTVSPVVEVYDPATEEWSRRTNLTTGRWSLSAEVLEGNIYAFGGIVNWDLATDANEMYDPATDRWTSEPSMLDIRMDFGSGVVGDCIYAVGGYRGFMAGHPNRSEEYCLGGDLTYEWDFDANVDSDGDGDYTNDKEATGPTPTHVYYDDSVYTVTLTVTDSQGLQDTDQCNVTVLNVPPTPEWTSRSADGSILNPPYPEGKEILFEATVYDPGIYDTFTYDWNFGDGTTLLDAGPSVIHAYGDNDTYTVVLKVTDDDGGVGIDDTPPLLTTNEDPVASISIPRCPFFEGGPACPMDGSFTDPGWLDTHSAVWDFGDGEYEIAVIAEENEPPDATGMNETSHVYGDNGVYNVTFTVVDDDGGTHTALAWASPYNLPPSITVDIPSSVNEGEHFNLGITATDPGSDDLFINIDWGDGTSESETYYNNGVGPDPPNSGPGVFPFEVHAVFSHVYGDDSNFTITVRVEDDDGGVAIDETIIIVENVPPTIEYFDYFFNASFAFRIAGEKWHNVEFHLFEDGTEIGYANITRYPGNPDDQMAHLADVSIDFSKRYSAIAYYTPEDDPINGQIWGATPAWVIMSYEDGSEERIHHTFNVRHEETWIWAIGDFTPYFIGHNITFVAIASDPGSDDLIFKWDWGDGASTEHIYYNNGMSPDPYPSPDVNPITVVDGAMHSYAVAGTYTVTLTVTDDDGGQATVSMAIGI